MAAPAMKNGEAAAVASMPSNRSAVRSLLVDEDRVEGDRDEEDSAEAE